MSLPSVPPPSSCCCIYNSTFEQCPICLCEYNKPEQEGDSLVTPCGHKYHRTCFETHHAKKDNANNMKCVFCRCEIAQTVMSTLAESIREFPQSPPRHHEGQTRIRFTRLAMERNNIRRRLEDQNEPSQRQRGQANSLQEEVGLLSQYIAPHMP